MRRTLILAGTILLLVVPAQAQQTALLWACPPRTSMQPGQIAPCLPVGEYPSYGACLNDMPWRVGGRPAGTRLECKVVSKGYPRPFLPAR